MSQSLCHTGVGLTLPYLHIDIQRWDLQRANAAILLLVVLRLKQDADRLVQFGEYRSWLLNLFLCIKVDYNTIFKNDIIMDLIKILGCGVDIPKKYSKDLPAFDIDRLRWHKVIICTDADVDGFQIRTLILAMFYRLTPELIRQKKVFIAESPLYEISHRAKKLESTYFAYTDQEKNEILTDLTEGKVHVQRSKGLGENEPGMMWTTTMNPETRRLISVMPEDEETMQASFDLLLGDDIPGRRHCIEEKGHLYMAMLDVV